MTNGKAQWCDSNLFDETVNAIIKSGHKKNDVVFIGSEITGHSCSWLEFESLANRDYDNDLGCQEVARDLIVAFSDGGKLLRISYDGSESWSYDPPFVKPEITKPIFGLFVSNGALSDIN